MGILKSVYDKILEPGLNAIGESLGRTCKSKSAQIKTKVALIQGNPTGMRAPEDTYVPGDTALPHRNRK